MAQSIGVNLSAKALCDDVDVIILKVLSHSGDKRHTYRCSEQQPYAPEKLSRRVLRILRRVIVDHVAKDHRIEQRKDLIDRRKNEDQYDECPILLKVGIEKFHTGNFKLDDSCI